jgi:SAM-dependent methyltransferase
VEVDARMAEFAREHGFDVEVSRFENWDSAGRTFDAVIAGMTWHWVDPVAGAAKAAAVLRPGGRLTAFWTCSSRQLALQKRSPRSIAGCCPIRRTQGSLRGG